MSESGDFDPGVWTGFDFKSARNKFDVNAGRSYADAVKSDKKIADLVPENVSTDSESPVVVICDVTGSMGEWPATIFSKLAYLDIEGKEYMGDTMAFSFAAIGDQYSDKYPLQVYPFCKGKDMETTLGKMIVEGGGGGQTCESYDLGALYYLRNCDIPNAIKPLLIFIGDEGLYDFIDKGKGAEWARTKVEDKLSVKQVFEDLQKKFSVYLVRKPYTTMGDAGNPTDRGIYDQWEKMLGADRISILPEAGRVVDVIFGIMAKETDKIDYFKKELTDRQTADQVNTVMKSLKTIHLASEVQNLVDRTDGEPGKADSKKGGKKAKKSMKKLPPGASITHHKMDGKDAKSLLD